MSADHRLTVRAAIMRDDNLLLVEIDDETGLHYNLPGGGVEPGETIEQALHREMLEETTARITMQDLLLVWEYHPTSADNRYGTQAVLALIFRCHLHADDDPQLPTLPDPNHKAVRWFALADLTEIALIPPVQMELIAALRAEPRQHLLRILR